MKWYRLDFPMGLAIADVVEFTRSLSARRRQGLVGSASPVLFEIESSKDKLTWFIGLAHDEDEHVRTLLQHCIPNIRLTPVERKYPRLGFGVELRMNEQRRSLRTDIAPGAARAILGVLQSVHRDETVVVQWLVGPWIRRRVVRPPTRARKDDTGISLDFNRLVLDSEQTKAMRDKQKEPLFGVVGRIAVGGAMRSRQRRLLRDVVGALQVVRQPGVGFQRRLVPGTWIPGRLIRNQQPWVAYPNILSASELASVLAWPIDGPVLPGISYSGHRQLPPPNGAVVRNDNMTERITGEISYPSVSGFLQLRPSDALRHLHVVGPTGVGKSTLLAQLLLADIRGGRAAVLLDPKGDLVTDVLERIPRDRLDDVVLLDPTDEKYAVGFNPLAGRDQELAVDGVLHVLRNLYSAYWGPRSQDIFHAGLLTLAMHNGFTLCELPALLTNQALRRRLTQTARKDVLGLGPFWQWYEQLSDAERVTVTGPVLNKVRAFTMRRAIRGVIGQSQGFDLKRILTERKILLVNLSAGRLGPETAFLLGALLMSQLWQVIQSRADIPPERRHPVFVYLDEFQSYLRLPVDLGNALVTARGLGAGLILAHQHLGQLDTAVRSAVLANARSRIVFQTAHDDAAALARLMGNGLTADDLTGLGNFETYQRLSVGGSTATAASARTLPLPAPTGLADKVRQHSQETYARRRSEVDDEMTNRRQVKGSTDAPIGVIRRPKGGRS